MSNNVRVLAEDQILSHNQGEERNISVKIPDKVSKRYVQDLEEAIVGLKTENRRLTLEIIEMGRDLRREMNQQSIMWLD